MEGWLPAPCTLFFKSKLHLYLFLGTSTAMALLEVTNKAVCLIQGAAETTYDVVSPAELHRHERRLKKNWRTLGYQAVRKQPVDLREGLSNAVNVMKDGMNDTAVAIVQLTQKV